MVCAGKSSEGSPISRVLQVVGRHGSGPGTQGTGIVTSLTETQFFELLQQGRCRYASQRPAKKKKVKSKKTRDYNIISYRL